VELPAYYLNPIVLELYISRSNNCQAKWARLGQRRKIPKAIAGALPRAGLPPRRSPAFVTISPVIIDQTMPLVSFHLIELKLRFRPRRGPSRG